MSNFAFVHHALPELYQDCAKAEGYLVTDAPTACFYARRAIEGLVEYIYRVRGIYRPEQASLSTLLSNDAFSVHLDNDKRLKFKTIRLLGNDAAHNSRRVLSQRDAERAVADLYHLMVWGIYNHSATPELAPGNPETWLDGYKMTTIGGLAEPTQYGTSANAGSTGEYPVLRMGNITNDGKIDLSFLKYMNLPDNDVDKYTVRRGDLLFKRTNSTEKAGKAAAVMTDKKLAYAGYLVQVRFKNPNHAHFTATFFNSAYGMKFRRKPAKTAVDQANINAQELCKIALKSPKEKYLKLFTTIVENC